MGKKKTSKHRGSRTHGRGKKAGRGKGKRGGRGMAGTHKHRYTTILKTNRHYFGMHGFKRAPCLSKAKVTVNIRDLEKLESGDHVNVLKDKVRVDLNAMGIDKILGTGRPTRKYEVTVSSASKRAVEKIEEKGGKVNIVNVNTAKRDTEPETKK
jgi:large subunit ribosomal protein L15